MRGFLVAGLLLVATPVSAQFRTAAYVFAGTAAADWTMTSYGINKGRVHEANPALQWARNEPWKIVAAGAAGDAAGVWALNRYVAPKHPKIAAVTLYAQAALRVYFVSRGIQIIQQTGSVSKGVAP